MLNKNWCCPRHRHVPKEISFHWDARLHRIRPCRSTWGWNIPVAPMMIRMLEPRMSMEVNLTGFFCLCNSMVVDVLIVKTDVYISLYISLQLPTANGMANIRQPNHVWWHSGMSRCQNMFPSRTLLHAQHGTSTYLNKGYKSGTPSGKNVDWGSKTNLSEFRRGATSGLQRTMRIVEECQKRHRWTTKT